MPSRISRTMSSPARSRLCHVSQAERSAASPADHVLADMAGEQAAQRPAYPAVFMPAR